MIKICHNIQIQEALDKKFIKLQWKRRQKTWSVRSIQLFFTKGYKDKDKKYKGKDKDKKHKDKEE